MTETKAPNVFLLLQAWRGLAAIAVVTGHILYEVEIVAVENAIHFSPIDYPTGIGVDIFFVISGFVIVYASRRLIGQKRSFWAFMGRRISRIVPLYWFYTTLMVVAALAFPRTLDTAQADFWHILGSYFFIPHVRPAGDAIRPILSLGWSINYEMYFYALFGSLLFIPGKRLLRSLSLIFAGSVILGLAVPSSWTPLAFWFRPFVLEFLAGAWIGYLFLTGFRLPKEWFWILTGAGIIVLVLLKFVEEASWLYQVLALAPGTFLVSAATLPEGSMGIVPPRIVTALGDSSYSLYLSHPFTITLARLAWESHPSASAASLWVFGGIAFIACLLVGHLSYLLLEKPVLACLRNQSQARRTATQFVPLATEES